MNEKQPAALLKFQAPPQIAGSTDLKPQPIFPGFQKPSSDMESVRDGRRAPLLYLDIPLDSTFSIAGGNALVLPISGNSFYIDQDTNVAGNAYVHFQDTNLQTASAPIYVGAGFIAKVPFTQLLIENKVAQAGKKIRIVYGIDVDFTAGVNATIAVTNQAAVSNSATSNDTAVGAGATTALLAVNVNRKGIWLQNNTTGVLWVRFGAAAALNVGFPIAAGGLFTMDNNINTSSLSVYSVAAGNIHSMEW